MKTTATGSKVAETTTIIPDTTPNAFRKATEVAKASNSYVFPIWHQESLPGGRRSKEFYGYGIPK